MRLREPIGILPIVDVRGYAADGTVSGFVEPADVVRVTGALLMGGARTIQLRAKHLADRVRLELARKMRDMTRERGARLMVNDRPDIALLAEADFVHLGQSDLDAADVRRWLPSSIAIGVSCHTLDQALAARTQGVASYVGFGPVFRTTSKLNPDAVVGISSLREVCSMVGDLDVVAIGGITIDRLDEVQRAGASGAAMISGLLAAPDLEGAVRAAVGQWSAPSG